MVKVLLEGMYDPDCLFSWFRGHLGGHKIMRRILDHIIVQSAEYWRRLAAQGWSLEELARQVRLGENWKKYNKFIQTSMLQYNCTCHCTAYYRAYLSLLSLLEQTL